MNRYSRQLLYKNIDVKDQLKIHDADLCIIGMGALGTVAAELLVRSGVKKLTLIDMDYIEEHNLQRQTLYCEEDIGKPKATVSKSVLSKIDSSVRVQAYSTELTSRNIHDLVGQPSLILACTDNMASRFLINDYCKKFQLSWIFGAASGDKGMVYNITPGGPCLECALPTTSTENCDTSGILNSLSSVIASIMANESLKMIIHKNPEKCLLHFNIWSNEFLKIHVNKKKACKCCSGRYLHLNLAQPRIIRLCGSDMYQVRGRLDIERIQFPRDQDTLVHLNEFTVFKDGRVFVKAKNMKEASSKYQNFVRSLN